MAIYYLWAEHRGHRSIHHVCNFGIWYDPVDGFETSVEADDEDHAESLGQEILASRGTATCPCPRRLSAGSQEWWDSVHIVASRTPYPQYTGDPSTAVLADGSPL